MRKNKKGMLIGGLLSLIFLASFIAGSLLSTDDTTTTGSGGVDAATIATFQNSIIANIHEDIILNGTSWSVRELYPPPTEDLETSIGVLVLWFDKIQNDVHFINFTDIQNSSVGNRSFFVNINGNSTPVDPLNNTACFEYVDTIGEGYACAFVFKTLNVTASGGIFREVTLFVSATNHVRTVDVVYIIPKRAASTTTDIIVTFIFTHIQTLIFIIMDFIKIYAYIIKTVLILSLLGIIIFGLRLLYRWIAGRDERGT